MLFHDMHGFILVVCIYTDTEFLVLFDVQMLSQCNLNTAKYKNFIFSCLFLKQNLQAFNENSFRGPEIALGSYMVFISVL